MVLAPAVRWPWRFEYRATPKKGRRKPADEEACMTEAQKLSETLSKYDSKNILQGHVMSIIQNDVELELFSDKRHSKNRFCSFTVTAGDGQQAMKDWILLHCDQSSSSIYPLY